MNELESYFRWEVDENSGFRKLIINNIETPKTEYEKFKSYSGETKICQKCKRKLPKNTYFFMSSGNNSIHGKCKECLGSSFGWGTNKNTELQKINKKYCRKCDRILPLNEIYFSKNTGKCNTKTGFASNCKECYGMNFRIQSINSLKNILHIRPGYKICSYCLLELPSNDDYFYNRLDREVGQTICKKCKSIKDGKIVSGKRHLNMSKSHLLNDDEKFCTSCGEKFNKESIKRNNGIFLCDKCYKDRNKYAFQKRKTSKNNLIADLTTEEWNETLQYFNKECAYCGITEEDCFKKYHKYLAQEHVVPLSKGGGFTKSNIIPSCPICNSSKGNKFLDDLFIKSNKFTQERYNKIEKFMNLYSVS